ncbi:hypothetical protein B0H13DRAFT_2042888 [Mycena leptocephala]|nr:hypothetical protein B0H13DRAFT_2042888 [Mycena leptocephala]
MSSAKSSATKPSASTIARAERLSKRATSAPAPRIPTVDVPSAQAIRERSVIDADAADTPSTAVDAATSAPPCRSSVNTPASTHSTEDSTAHAKRAHSVFDVDGPVQGNGMEVDAAPTYAAATSAGSPKPAHHAAASQPPARTIGFPPLPTPGVEIQSPRVKGKGKLLTPEEDPDASSIDSDEEDNDPFLARDMAAARALSLGQQPDTTIPGASSSRTAPSRTSSSRTASSHTSSGTASSSDSSSRRPTAAPGSPPSAHANTGARLTRPHTLHPPNPFNPPRVDRPRYGTEDGNPPRGAFTPPPPGGWRPIFGIDSESIWLHHPAPQREMWDREPHPKFLAIPSGGNGDRLDTQRRIAEAIAGRVNITPTRVVVGPPSSPESGSDPGLGSSWGSCRGSLILDDRLLCYEGITVFFFPYTPSIAGFLVGFTGFTLHHRTGPPLPWSTSPMPSPATAQSPSSSVPTVTLSPPTSMVTKRWRSSSPRSAWMAWRSSTTRW